MKEIFQAAARALGDDSPVALVTVTRSIGSTPRHAAAKMLVRADGSFVGTIGGGSMEQKAIQDAQAALAIGTPGLVKYPLIGKSAQSLGLCGGTQEIFIDVLRSPAKNGHLPEMIELCETIVAACQAGEPIALITVVKSREGITWQAGDKALLRYDRSSWGKPGRGVIKARLLAAAYEALRENRPMRLGYRAKDGTFTELNSFRSEAVEFFVDVIQPRPELMIIGAGHIGLALADLARTLDWRVIVVDDRPEWGQRFLQADETIIVPYDAETETLAPLPVTITPSTHLVVATWGWDEPALAQVATAPAAYIGLVASRRKAKIIFDGLLERGIPEEALARMRVPAGLDLRAETPQEIALSIMAEILLWQRGASGRPMLEIKGHPLALANSLNRATPVSA